MAGKTSFTIKYITTHLPLVGQKKNYRVMAVKSNGKLQHIASYATLKEAMDSATWLNQQYRNPGYYG